MTPRSYLIDRMVPDCEEIRLQPKEISGGWLAYEISEIDSLPSRGHGRLVQMKARLGRGVQSPADRLLLDVRGIGSWTPLNWAHFLNDYLPMTFAIAGAAGLGWEQLTLLLPGRTPGYILDAAGLFGLDTLASDDRVRGLGIAFSAEPGIAIRSARAAWVRQADVAAALEAALAREASPALPERVFLSRRETRRISNEAEIASHLAAHGFQTVYPEDLPIVDQFRLIRQAREIVAIHGAGLAPLLYRPASTPPGRLVELFPCGHMTDNFRVIADHVGCRWIGVRGKIRPEHVRPAYDLEHPFVRHSLQDFEVDPASIDRAFALLDRLPDEVR